MATVNSGHSFTVSQFNEIIMIIINLNGKWNPISKKLLVPNLQTRHAVCDAMIKVVQAAVVVDGNKTKAREKAYDPLNDLVRRVLAACRSCEMEASTIEKVKKLKDLIDGTYVNQAAKTRDAKAEKEPIPERHSAWS